MRRRCCCCCCCCYVRVRMWRALCSALDLMRRLPPSDVEDNLAGLLDLAPDLVEDLLSAVDQPLKIAHDKAANRDYLLCDYNRDADSYRCAAAGGGAAAAHRLRP